VNAGQSFRRRSHHAGPFVLLDEAVAVFEADAWHWIVRGVLPSLPAAALALLFVHLHRVIWIDEPWRGFVPVLSGALALALVFALQVRAVGQGVLARDVVKRMHPSGELDALARTRWLSLVAVGTVGLTASLVGAAMLVLPGLVLAGFFVPLAAIVAVEGRDAGAAVSRARELPRGTTVKGALSVVLFAGLLFLLWLDILIGTQLGIYLLRMITGADVTVLARTLGLGNEAFVLGSLILAGLLLDPLWGIHKALLYLEARLGQTGADLEERWRALPDRRAASPALAGLLVLGLASAVSAPGPAAASNDLDRYAADLEAYRTLLDDSIRAYKSSGYEDLQVVRTSIEMGTRWDVTLPDGTVLKLDGAPLTEELPDRIHTDETARQAMRVSVRMERAIALARGDPVPSDVAADPRELLDAELADGSYALPAAEDRGEEFRSSFQDRFRTWWEGVVRRLTWTPPPRQQGPISSPVFPAFSGKWLIAGVAVLLAVGLAVFLLAQGGRIQVARPAALGGGAGGGGDLPDARQRSPLSWRDHADKLAAQGFLREAVRAQFLAVLARLDRTREIDYRPERTNGEHLRTFAGSDVRAGNFRDATSLFETAWYGAGGVEPASYTEMSTACDGLVARAGVPSGGDA
jgi:hypothetical protein